VAISGAIGCSGAIATVVCLPRQRSVIDSESVKVSVRVSSAQTDVLIEEVNGLIYSRS